MIKHIFKQIWVERRQNSWIILELAVVVFFLLLMSDFLWGKIKNYTEPKGFDINNTFMMDLKTLEPIAPEYIRPEDNPLTPGEEINKLVERIELYPDIECVSVSIFAAPYSMGGVWIGLRADSIYTQSMRCRTVTPSYFDVFRIPSADSKPIRVETAGFNRIILTRSVAEKLYGGASEAIGREIYIGEKPSEKVEEASRVIAVTNNLKRQDFYPYEDAYYEILTNQRLDDWLKTNDVTWINICVRVKAGTARHFLENFESDMGDLKVNNLYVSSVIPSEKLRDEIVGKMIREDITMLAYVMAFVLITVFLGVFGSFWLRTRQRRGQIAIRMAVGASRQAIWKYMVTEGLLLITVVIAPAFIAYINLLYAEVLDTWRVPVTAERVLITLCAATAITAFMVTAGINWPARQASGIDLSAALKEE